MDSTPPAWLRSYKAQSAIIPNFASQVRTELDGNPATKARPESSLSEKEANDDFTASNRFTFPSTISLTLHSVVSLNQTYSNSTPESSPKKTSFDPRLEQHPALRQTGPDLQDRPQERRRGPICRFWAAIRRAFASKTQPRLAH